MKLDEKIIKKIEKYFDSYKLIYSRDEMDEGYPLLDALTPDGESIDIGKKEIEDLIDGLILEIKEI